MVKATLFFKFDHRDHDIVVSWENVQGNPLMCSACERKPEKSVASLKYDWKVGSSMFGSLHVFSYFDWLHDHLKYLHIGIHRLGTYVV